MSLPTFSTQAELFSTAGLSCRLFAPTDRYRLFAQLVYPVVAAVRGELEKCYRADNGRVAVEPVLMLGVSLLQYLDGLPDRQAVEMVRYHAGWNFALHRQLGDELFHPTTRVNFRPRLIEPEQSALGFQAILDALAEAGLVSRQSRQRLDSTQMFGLVSRMSRLDCVRESLRLALKELDGSVGPETRPGFWLALWERYVESQIDYRASGEVLGRKLVEAGTDTARLLAWAGGQSEDTLTWGPQLLMEAEQMAMGLDKPPVQYVDGAYVSAEKLAQAQAEERSLIGPAAAAPHHNGGRYTTEDFDLQGEQRQALCPAGKANTQCSKLGEPATGKVTYRFEWSTQCADCPLRERCVGPEQKHRSLVVGQHHRVWQSRRREQKTQAFAQQMKHRNGIEGTQSELVRAHGIRRARSRGWAKVRLQNYFAAAACNLKRWIRRKVWELAPVQTATALGGAGTRGGRAPLRWLRKPARHKRG